MAIPVSKTGSVLVIIGLVGLCLANEAESVTSSSPPPTQHWIQTPVPLYYLITLGIICLTILITFTICLVCTRRRRKQEYVINGKNQNSKQEPAVSFNKTDDSSIPSVVIIKQATPAVDENKDTDNTNGDEQGGPVIYECIDLKENTTSDQEDQIWTLRESEQQRQNTAIKRDNESTKQSSEEPLYAEVKKPEKEKQTSTNVVYAELVGFESNRDTQGQRLSTEYAEITRIV